MGAIRKIKWRRSPGSVPALHLILLGVHGLPAPVTAHEDVGEDATAGFFAGFVAGNHDAMDDGGVAVEANLGMIEASLMCFRRQVLHEPVDMLFFRKEDADRDRMHKVSREDSLESSGIACRVQQKSKTKTKIATVRI
jgi:hypothetical protein